MSDCLRRRYRFGEVAWWESGDHVGIARVYNDDCVVSTAIQDRERGTGLLREPSAGGMALIAVSNGLDFSRMYEMDHSFKAGVFHLEPVTVIRNSGAILRGEENPPGSMEFRPMKGLRPADIMGTTLVAIRLISERFVNLLLENQFTGWSTTAVSVQDRDGTRISGHSCLVVSGRSGPIDSSKSRIVLDPPPVPHGAPTYVEVGMYFDPQTWDGSDIFIPQGTTTVCVVERVKGVMERAKISNVQFTALSQFQGNRFLEPPPGRKVNAPSTE